MPAEKKVSRDCSAILHHNIIVNHKFIFHQTNKLFEYGFIHQFSCHLYGLWSWSDWLIVLCHHFFLNVNTFVMNLKWKVRCSSEGVLEWNRLAPSPLSLCPRCVSVGMEVPPRCLWAMASPLSPPRFGRLRGLQGKLLRRYDHQPLVACLSGLYGCRWRRWERSRTRPGDCCCDKVRGQGPPAPADVWPLSARLHL